MMREIILKALKELEKEYSVRILYACEAGSRAWGLASPNSDYDVRFIYIHPVEQYLSIDPIGVGYKRDVIEKKIGSQVEITGWELTKTLRLFRKSNLSLMEWLNSSIIYSQSFSTFGDLHKLTPTYFSPRSCILHYVNMAKTNLKKLDHQPFIKNYINVVRPVLAARWLTNYQQFPPVDMQLLMLRLLSDGSIKDTTSWLMREKIAGNEVMEQIETHRLLQYLNEEIEQMNKFVQTTEKNDVHATENLDKLFRKTLTEVWK